MLYFDSLRSRAKGRSVWAAFGVVMTLGVSACSTPPAHYPAGQPWDPYETRNRAIHDFNKDVDRYALRHTAKGFSAVVPDDIETFLSRLSDTLSLPGSVVNSLLQGDIRGAGADTTRFVINSTLGLGGVFDAATEMGLPDAQDTDFGETLHVWDVNQGGYVVLPFLGPSTERDAVGKVVNGFLDPFNYVLFSNAQLRAKVAVNVASGLSARGGPFGTTIDSVLDNSSDSYVQTRSIYLQNRQFQLGEDTGAAYGDPYDDPYGPLEQ